MWSDKTKKADSIICSHINKAANERRLSDIGKTKITSLTKA